MKKILIIAAISATVAFSAITSAIAQTKPPTKPPPGPPKETGVDICEIIANLVKIVGEKNEGVTQLKLMFGKDCGPVEEPLSSDFVSTCYELERYLVDCGFDPDIISHLLDVTGCKDETNL